MLARFRENLIYKLLALGFAIALHFYVVGQETPVQTRTVPVPLSVRGLPPNLLYDEKTAPPVAVVLSGPADELNRLSDTQVIAAVDVSKAHAGKNAPRTVRVTLPPNVTGLSAEAQPGAVAVSLLARGERSVTITASDPGPPPAGFRFRPAKITPRSARIEGSQELVDSVRQVVANVDAGDSVGTIDSEFPVVALDGGGAQVGGVTVTPTSAHVRIEMGKVPAAKTLIVSANLTGSLPYPYKVTGVSISPETVTVAGRPELLSQAFTVQTALIDLSGMTADVTRRVSCTPPTGLSVVGPSQVDVTVHIASPPVPPVPVSPPVVAAPDGPSPAQPGPQ